MFMHPQEKLSVRGILALKYLRPAVINMRTGTPK
jgi:hypothetical protein